MVVVKRSCHFACFLVASLTTTNVFIACAATPPPPRLLSAVPVNNRLEAAPFGRSLKKSRKLERARLVLQVAKGSRALDRL